VETDALAHRLGRQSPLLRIARDRQRVDDLSRRAGLAMVARLRSARELLRSQRLHLSALDPTAVLSRGYAIVTRSDGAVVGSIAQVAAGDALNVRVTDGEFGVIVTKDG
jgi:exodeoxyribonuclease VII large subunit